MKIRCDFVSNSSSCSFIIRDPGKAAEVFSKAFSGIEIPYEFQSDLEIYAGTKNKWFREVEEDLTGESNFKNSYVDFRDGAVHKKDPEDIGFDCIHLTLDGLADAGKHRDSYAKLNDIRFSCQDYNRSAVIILKTLYDFFLRNGCRPSTEDSEIEFRFDRANEFFKILESFTVDEKTLAEEPAV